MKISSIVAMGKNKVIGRAGGLPWKIPSETNHFLKVLGNHYFLVGRKNYDCSAVINETAKALVLSRQKDLSLNHPVFNDFDTVLNYARQKGEDELFILGGAGIYELTLPYIDRLYLSIVDYEGEGDTFFPEHEKYQWIQKDYQINEINDHDTPLSWEYYLLEKK